MAYLAAKKSRCLPIDDSLSTKLKNRKGEEADTERERELSISILPLDQLIGRRASKWRPVIG